MHAVMKSELVVLAIPVVGLPNCWDAWVVGPFQVSSFGTYRHFAGCFVSREQALRAGVAHFNRLPEVRAS